MAASTKTGKIRRESHIRGFTLVELLLVLFLIALLASLVTPIVTNSIQRARESTLKDSLHVMRKAIDDYYADTGKYPEDLQVLVDKRYIRAVPVDPMTERSDTWILQRGDGHNNGVSDIHSGSDLASSDEGRYQEW